MRHVLVAVALAAMAAACAPVPPVVAPEPQRVPEATTVSPPAVPEPPPEPEPVAPLPVVPPPPDESRQVTELVAYAQRFAMLSPDEQRRDYNVQAQLFGRERSLASRIRLALALSTPGSAVQDDARAIGLLEGVPAGSSAARQFAAFLQLQLAERQRAVKRADQLKEQLDALRAVERSIIERGGAATPRKP